MGICGCSSSDLRPVTLATASNAQFELPVIATVVDGTSGIEFTPANVPHWWLISSDADITVSNTGSDLPALVLSAGLETPPCAAAVDIVVTPAGGQPKRVHATAAGAPLAVNVTVPRGQSATLHVAVLTPSCVIATDPRHFYAGLNDLKASPGAAN
jgi:hypothetical protein